MNVVYLNNFDGDIKDSPLTNKDYTIADFAMVRITNGFPHNHIVETPKSAKVLINFQPQSMWRTIIKLLQEKYPENFSNYLDDFKMIQSLPRDTIHFCLNGLVSKHMYGTFTGDYVIIDALSSHINNNNLRSLRVEDTYFNGDLELSSKASIVISREKYEVIKNDPNYISDLENYNIFVYEGNNQTKAVQEALQRLGYSSFIINEHGYQNGTDTHSEAYRAIKFIQQYCALQGINMDRHFDSDDNREEREIMRQDSIRKELELFEIICTELAIDMDFVEEMKYYIENQMIYTQEFENNMYDILSKYGLDKLKKIILQTNNNTLELLKSQSKSL